MRGLARLYGCGERGSHDAQALAAHKEECGQQEEE